MGATSGPKVPAADKVVAATVCFSERLGQGVLIPGNMILTAAHVITYAEDAWERGLALGYPFLEKIVTADGRQLTVSPIAIEPLWDIAVLVAPDGDAFPKEDEDFDAFCDDTEPVRVAVGYWKEFDWFPVFVRSHEKKWIGGRARSCHQELRGFASQMEEPVISGTSGGPVVDDDGQLLGVVSTATEAVQIPYPMRTLPVWVVDRIKKGQEII